MQGSLCMLGSHAAAVAAVKSADKNARLMWAVSGAMLGSVLPYTVFVMLPTYKSINTQVGGCVASCSHPKVGQPGITHTLLSLTADQLNSITLAVKQQLLKVLVRCHRGVHTRHSLRLLCYCTKPAHMRPRTAQSLQTPAWPKCSKIVVCHCVQLLADSDSERSPRCSYCSPHAAACCMT